MSGADAPVAVVHEASGRRFTATVAGETAELTYRRFPGLIVFDHTEVPESLRGHGIADALAHAALEHARTEQLGVIAVCPFVQAYLRRHPEYDALVKPV